MDNSFSVHSDTEDVEVVLAAVAEAVRRWEGGEAITLSLDLIQNTHHELRSAAQRLPLQSHIDSNAIIHSTRPRYGPWIIRFQHLVRRLTWWFQEPIIQQIRSYQSNSARVVAGMADSQEALLADSAHIQRQLLALEKEVETLRSRLAQLETQNAG
jgi:hypothetical protein